jgi:hypothetical protein
MAILPGMSTSCYENIKSNNMENSNDFVDLEEYALQGKIPPKNAKYQIRIDKKKYQVSVQFMTGKQILELAGKLPPENFQLRQRLKGGSVKKIGLQEKVDFAEPGIEKFMTIPIDQTEG